MISFRRLFFISFFCLSSLIYSLAVFCNKMPTWTDDPEFPSIEPRMVFVPAGEFQMGDNFNEWTPNERPVHTVYLDAFYIGKYEVTNGQYAMFMKDGGYENAEYWTNGGWGRKGHGYEFPLYWADRDYRGGGLIGNENFPVVGIDWYEAMAYCTWLSRKTGKTYRLPTEAEWEKAARGTDQRRYPWGNSIDGSYASYNNSGHPYGGLTPVGFFNGSVREGFVTHNNASPCGAYDMAGNVREWCMDFYDENYYTVSPDSNPVCLTYVNRKVIRGGGWNIWRMYARSAYRSFYYTGSRDDVSIGFRIVREN